jgi:hypothetical protein
MTTTTMTTTTMTTTTMTTTTEGAPGGFEARVLARTGRNLAEIPLGDENDLLGGHIVAHDAGTNTFVVFVGWPEHEDETGTPFWEPTTATRKVTLP